MEYYINVKVVYWDKELELFFKDLDYFVLVLTHQQRQLHDDFDFDGKFVLHDVGCGIGGGRVKKDSQILSASVS